MENDKVAVYAQVNEKVKALIVEASGFRGRGEIVQGLQKLTAWWEHQGKPVLAFIEETKSNDTGISNTESESH